LHVHDWDEYGGALVERRDRNAKRMKDARTANVQGTCDARAANVQDTCNARARLDRKIDRKKDLTENRPVDNSTVRPVSAQERTCWRCGDAITGDEVLDDKCVVSKRGIRHLDCAVAS